MKIYRTNRKFAHEHLKMGPTYRHAPNGDRRSWAHIHRFALLHIGVTISYREVEFK